MNYLAHAMLAQANAYSLVGNLLGDFCKGLDIHQQHPQILAGLYNHRAVDRFTDQHPLVVQARQTFSPQRRRFAGIALDVLFDHLLIKHWPSFYSGQFLQHKPILYARFAAAEPLMPDSMRSTIRQLRLQDWFSHYQQLTSLGQTLDRIATRIRFKHQFNGIIQEIEPRYSELDQLFQQFYPQLQQQVKQLALEL